MRRRILIVDDEPYLGRLFKAMLDTSWECESYERAQTALSRLREQHFDVIVSDYNMPEMNGVDFFRKAIMVDPLLASRFLFISASHDNDFIAFVEASGINHLAKPVTVQELQGAVAQILHGS